MSKLFEPDKEYIVKVEGLLSRKGQREIEELVQKGYGVEPMLEDFDGFEVVNPRGKMTKRLKNNLKKTRGIKLENGDISQIGNIMANNTVEAGEYIIVISGIRMDVFDGHRSLYTNRDTFNPSCFQEGHAMHHHWQAMRRNPDFYAVRIAQGDEPDELIARSWLMDDYKFERLVVFNGYGLTLNEQAILLSRALDVEVVEMRVYYSDLYVNGDTCRVLGRGLSELRPYQIADVRIRAGINDRDSTRLCGRCDRQYDLSEEGIEEGGVAYRCGDCVIRCDICERPRPIDSITRSPFSDRHMCRNCYEEERSQHVCCECGSRSDDGLQELDGYVGRFCANCVTSCDECESRHPRVYMRTSDRPGVDTLLCQGCHHDERRRWWCGNCGSYMADPDSATVYRGHRYCEDCTGSCAWCEAPVIGADSAYWNPTDGRYDLCLSCSRRISHISREVAYSAGAGTVRMILDSVAIARNSGNDGSESVANAAAHEVIRARRYSRALRHLSAIQEFGQHFREALDINNVASESDRRFVLRNLFLGKPASWVVKEVAGLTTEPEVEAELERDRDEGEGEPVATANTDGSLGARARGLDNQFRVTLHVEAEREIRGAFRDIEEELGEIRYDPITWLDELDELTQREIDDE